MAKPKKILVATTNPGKVEELKTLLGLGLEWASLLEMGISEPVKEDGQTFAANARKKACTYARLSRMWTISDDSGLVIDALGGLPGVMSARFAGVDGPDRRAIDLANIRKVLDLMAQVPWPQRTARFICHICLADPKGVLAEATGTLEGLIALEPAGDRGFGYDPIFFVPRLNCTVAQLDQGQKNAISHRGQAIRAMLPELRGLLEGRGPAL